MEFVDLGLNVKWAKYNLGATCENTPESWYGDYYAWGELKSKSEYWWSTYKFGSLYALTKYNSNNANNLLLESFDDVIVTTYGKTWRMPSRNEFKQLMSLHNEWITNYEGISGLNGRLFIGNGNSLFIPAVGYFSGNEHYDTNYCYLWSNTLDVFSPTNAYCFYCAECALIVGQNRFQGLPIRGVYI